MPRYDDRYSSTRLYVGHLSSRTRERDLERLFSKYGRVRDVDMKRDYAFVDFSDPRDADDARYRLDGRDFDGSRIIVEFAKGTPRGSREYSSSRGPPPGTGRCFNCGVDGHWARDCTAGDWKNKCYRCGDRGHIERNCKNSPKKLRRGESYSRSPVRSRSRSRSPRRRRRSRSRSRSRSYSRGRSYSRSRSPVRKEKAWSPEPAARSMSPEPAARSMSPEPAARSMSPELAARSMSPEPVARSMSPEPVFDKSPRTKDRKRSPTPEEGSPMRENYSPRENGESPRGNDDDNATNGRQGHSPSPGGDRSPSPGDRRSPRDDGRSPVEDD